MLLLETNMSAGHGGASGRYDYLKEIALDYAFLLQELGRVRSAYALRPQLSERASVSENIQELKKERPA